MNFRVLRTAISLALAGILLSSAIAADGQRFSGESSTTTTSKSDYVLQPQDEIRVQVLREEDINKQGEGISISQECTVTLPLIGTVSLKGKSVRQAEEMIRGMYDKDYIINPQVTVTVTKYAERTVNVIGSVTNQGRVPFPKERGLTIIEAIALAGGQTRLADLKKVKLTRKNANGDSEMSLVDVDAMMKSGGRDAVTLQPDDVIFVPERIL